VQDQEGRALVRGRCLPTEAEDVFQPWEGGRGDLSRYFATVDWAISTPSINNSP